MTYWDLMHGEDQWILGPRRKYADDYGYDVWAYGRCQRVGDSLPVPFEIDRGGKVTDYNPVVFRSIVISEKLCDLLQHELREDQIEVLPADVQGATGTWYVLNVLDCVDCIDRTQSIIEYFPADHSRKPGQPRGIERLIIDPLLAREHDLFRIADWKSAVIASDRLKQVMEEHGITGIDYWPVCAGPPIFYRGFQ